MMLLQDSLAALSLGFLCEEMSYSDGREAGMVSIVKDGKLIRWKPENHVPVVAVSQEFRVPG